MTASKDTESKAPNQTAGMKPAMKRAEFKANAVAAKGSKLAVKTAKGKGKPEAMRISLTALSLYKKQFLMDVLDTEPTGYVPTSYIYAQAAERWKSMSDEEKAPFEAKAAALKNTKIVIRKFPGDDIAEHQKAMESVRRVALVEKMMGLGI